jgi:L-alanine-DL-glutamate epimerase-like enolase superfamily enzyme
MLGASRALDPITEVEALTTRLELPRPLRLGPLEIRHRDYVVVTVTTASGLEGKAFSLTRGTPAAAVVSEVLAPLLVGRDADLVAARWDECFRATIAAGRTGVVMRALSLVDAALWDVKAQRAGLPLWRLLGGAEQDVPTMIVAAYPTGEPPAELGAKVVHYAERGWRLLKIARIPNPEGMRTLLESAANGLPAGAELVVDAAWVWRRPRDAVRELRLWGQTPLAWIEDPFPPEDIPAYVELRRSCNVPLGAGDDVTDRHVLRAHLQASSLDVVRVDATTIGGITGALRVLQLAADAGVPVSFHVYPELHVHLAAAFPDGSMIETFDRDDNPFDPAELLYIGGPVHTPGRAVAPETPGVGYRLDRERIEHGRR